MQRKDIQDELQDTFEPGPLPPLQPDGAVSIPALRPALNPPPRLCEAGPCIHYHHMVVQLDAARPIANELGVGGTLVGEAPPQPYHTEAHHYCYPNSGIETQLGSLPVIRCNLWQPKTVAEKTADEARLAEFIVRPDGQVHFARLAQWEQQQRAAMGLENYQDDSNDDNEGEQQ